MKILDRYIARNYLTGYAIAFCVLMGLRILIDLFVGLDEFVENADQGTMAILEHIARYYALNLTLYFRDFSGMITVVAAAFSLARMIRSNELTAIMASGVSLKRVVGPILGLSLVFVGILVVNQELIIPRVSHMLVRSKDDIPGEEVYAVTFLSDNQGSLICAPLYDVNSCTFHNPTIITRKYTETGIYKVTGRITAEKAVYNHATGQWDLTQGRLLTHAESGFQAIASYPAEGLIPKDIPVMIKAKYKALLSFQDISALESQNPKDMVQLLSQKHFRITDPIINFVTLMISLPILVCRDPRSMKSAVMISFGLTTACYLFTFACKMLATEEMFFSRVIPEFWAWLPILIFLPIAFIELDSMKT